MRESKAGPAEWLGGGGFEFASNWTPILFWVNDKGMDKRSSIINVITSPLGFFALALLLVEGFLGIAISSNNPSAVMLGMWMAASAFVLVVVIVALMVCFIPDKLTFSSEDHLKKLERNNSWGVMNSPSTKQELNAHPANLDIIRKEQVTDEKYSRSSNE